VLARYGQRHFGKKDGLSQDTEQRNDGGRSSAITRAAHHDRKTSWRQAHSSTLGEQVLALANGKTQQEITAACKGARPNHVGAAIARHKRAGRIVQHAIADIMIEIEGMIPHADRIAEDWTNRIDHGSLWPAKLVAAKYHCVESAFRVVWHPGLS
jgi:hypothetical protein